MLPVIGILRKEGYEVQNADFFKIGIPFTLSAIIPAYIYIWLLFGVYGHYKNRSGPRV